MKKEENEPGSLAELAVHSTHMDLQHSHLPDKCGPFVPEDLGFYRMAGDSRKEHYDQRRNLVGVSTCHRNKREGKVQEIYIPVPQQEE